MRPGAPRIALALAVRLQRPEEQRVTAEERPRQVSRFPAQSSSIARTRRAVAQSRGNVWQRRIEPDDELRPLTTRSPSWPCSAVGDPGISRRCLLGLARETHRRSAHPSGPQKQRVELDVPKAMALGQTTSRRWSSPHRSPDDRDPRRHARASSDRSGRSRSRSAAPRTAEARLLRVAPHGVGAHDRARSRGALADHPDRQAVQDAVAVIEALDVVPREPVNARPPARRRRARTRPRRAARGTPQASTG